MSVSTMTKHTTDEAVASGKRRVLSAVLAASTDAATLTLDDGATAGGTERLVLKAAANTSITWRAGAADGVAYSNGVFITMTGTSPVGCVEWQ